MKLQRIKILRIYLIIVILSLSDWLKFTDDFGVLILRTMVDQSLENCTRRIYLQHALLLFTTHITSTTDFEHYSTHSKNGYDYKNDLR